MVKRAKVSTQEQIALVFELYKRIPQSYKTTAKELQVQLNDAGIERDVRTIQRNLDVIVQYFDIEKDDRTKPYGYRRRDNNFIVFGPQEALLLALAGEHLKYLLPVSLMNSLKSTFRDAKYHLFPNTTNEKERQWLKKVKLIAQAPDDLPPKISTNIFEKVSHALYNNYWISIEFKNKHLEGKNKEMMPLGLAQQNFIVYLVFRFKDSQVEMVVAVHDIVKVSLSSFGFTYPSDFELANFDIVNAISFSKTQAVTLAVENIPPTSEVKANFHLPNSAEGANSIKIQNKE